MQCYEEAVNNAGMLESSVSTEFYFDLKTNRNKLFKEALLSAAKGKVLYILHEEFKEMPQLSQECGIINRHYMKMISFLYVSNLDSLIDSVSSLPNWTNVPVLIILEGLDKYCPENKQMACSLIAILIDTVRSCSVALKQQCQLLISANEDVYGDDFCRTLQELYSHA